jgi:hypothetical protein
MRRRGAFSAASSKVAKAGGGSHNQEAENFINLIASKFCTPPPTRLVV